MEYDNTEKTDSKQGSEIAEAVCEILERDSRRYSGFRETEAAN